MNAIPAALNMNTNSILHKIFSKVMDRIISAGIPQYLESKADLFFGTYQEFKKKIPKVLSLDDLSFGFILWMYACAISIFGFLIECSRDYLGLFCLMYNLMQNLMQINISKINK